MRNLTRLAPVRRNDPEIRRFEEPTVGDERNALPVRREDGVLIFERSIRNLFWLAAFCGEQIDMTPPGVLKNCG